jgi:alpha-glucosidase (family GH31 glycosyl hydrolase)
MKEIKWFKIFSSVIILFAFSKSMYAQERNIFRKQIKLLPGEFWWAGVINKGIDMPAGKKEFAFDFYGDDNGNQASPLLISNRGRYIWSENPYKFTFGNDSLVIQSRTNDIIAEQAGGTLKDAYRNASKKYFPSKGQWPDSLLITAPQYNLWIELMYKPTQKDVLDYAHKVLQNGLPPGVLMIDDNWTNYYGQFDFDKEKFPDPKEMIRQLHSLGFKVMLWICPFISPDSEVYRELASAKSLLLDNEGKAGALYNEISKPLLMGWWNGYSACIDLTNPSATNWITKKLLSLQQKYGVDGFKLDGGDVHYYDNPALVSYEKKNPNEHTYLWAKLGLNFPLNEYRAMWKMGGQPLVQRLRDKAHNWEDLNTLIPGTIVQQLMGYTFTCPDMIGGGDFVTFLEGNKIDQKLIVRSAQCSGLMPMMQFSVAPWRILDSAHLDAVKKVVKTRQQYLPVLMDVIRRSAVTGEPVLRPLEYDYPNQGLEEVKDEFLIGENLLVAPVVTSDDNRTVKFPKGKWKYNNKTITGPATKTYQVALDELLIFEKQTGK